MTILSDAPGRFWALSAERATHSAVVVGTTEVLLALKNTTRAVQICNVLSSPLFYRVDTVTVTAANGMFLPAQSPTWLYVEAGTVIRVVSTAVGQDVRVLEVAA